MTAVVQVATRRSVPSSTEDGAASQDGEVNSAMATVVQKKISASPACALEIVVGRKKRTVRPPSTPWRITDPSAATPSHFIQRRDSAIHSQAARMIVRKPTVLAISR